MQNAIRNYLFLGLIVACMPLVYAIPQRQQPQLLDTQLMQAIESGNSEKVKELLKQGADVNFDQECFPPLWSAIKSRNPEICKLLIAAGANVNGKHFRANTRLMEAIEQGLNEIAALLISRGADINALSNGYTALTVACMQVNLEMCKLLIKHGANVNAQGAKETALANVAKNFSKNKNDATKICNLLIANGANVNAKGANGFTALHIADSPEAVRILIEAGADVNAKSTKNNIFENEISVLARNIASCSWNKLGIQKCKLLIAAGADANAKDTNDVAPLMLAIREAPEICEQLINAGADVNAQDKDGKTPLMAGAKVCACGAGVIKNDLLNAYNLLIKNGANINAQDKEGKTPLMVAFEKDVCKLLLNAGADVNVQDKAGETALMHAVKNRPGRSKRDSKEICKILLQSNANVMLKNKKGKTALEIALDDRKSWTSDLYPSAKQKGPHQEICELLIDRLPGLPARLKATISLKMKIRKIRKDLIKQAQEYMEAQTY